MTPKDKPGLFERDGTIRLIIWLVIGICALSAISEFFIHKHGHFAVEDFPVFYGLFGFAAFFFVVLAGKVLRKLIMRDEDYYDRD